MVATRFKMPGTQSCNVCHVSRPATGTSAAAWRCFATAGLRGSLLKASGSPAGGNFCWSTVIIVSDIVAIVCRWLVARVWIGVDPAHELWVPRLPRLSCGMCIKFYIYNLKTHLQMVSISLMFPRPPPWEDSGSSQRMGRVLPSVGITL
jgi:hypothetical protein